MIEVEVLAVRDAVALVAIVETPVAITVPVVVEVAAITVVLVSVVEARAVVSSTGAKLVLLNTIKNAKVVCKQGILRLSPGGNSFIVV